MNTLARVMTSLALLMSCVPATAQMAKPAKQTTASITGRVAAGSKPVAYATLMLSVAFQTMAQAPAKATTDQEGRYTFTGLAPGQYNVMLFASAYVSTWGESAMSTMKTVTIEEGEAVETLDFSLVRGGVITGRVTDSRSKPIIGERIHLVGADGQDRAGQGGGHRGGI